MRNGNRKQKPGHDPVLKIELVPLASIRPSEQNVTLYGDTTPETPGISELADGIRETIKTDGLDAIDPLAITTDNVLLSGHRRRAAFQLLGIESVYVHRLPVSSADPRHMAVLARYNQQREKTPAERIREQLALSDPAKAHVALIAERVERVKIKSLAISLGKHRRRHGISAAKTPFLDAVKRVLEELEEYLPISDRRVHYALLNDPPLIHAKKPKSRYRNDAASYKALTDILTRARLAGEIPFEAIGDETRPVDVWPVSANVAPFVANEANRFLTNYWRNLMQGQPNHIEIVGEKMTVQGTITPVAQEFTIPVTIGRGFSSLPPRKAMYDRFKASGKAKLAILFLADLDPEGVAIAESFARSMRDDFGVANVHAVRVGLNAEQVQQLNLPPNTEAKTSSSRFKQFVERFGRFAYELEAVAPDVLQGWLRQKIREVIDVEAFNAQVELEKKDAATLQAYRKAAMDFLKNLSLPSPDAG
ncbi:MAG: hypothetical protein U0792_00580 [Gemmataceae bacterium]